MDSQIVIFIFLTVYYTVNNGTWVGELYYLELRLRNRREGRKTVRGRRPDICYEEVSSRHDSEVALIKPQQ